MRFQQQKRTKVGVGSGIQAVLVIACVVVMAACGEPIGPRTICCTPKPPQPETNSGLSVLAAELHDAADIFAQGVADAAVRRKAETAVNNLADQLRAGKVEASRDALYQARVLLTNVDETSSIELAPVGLALNYIERRMTEIVDLGAFHG
jgi:hypothetical protein